MRAIIFLLPVFSGCAALKTGGVAGVSAGVGGLVGGPAGAAAGAAVGASATSLMTGGVSGGECDAPVTGFWELTGALVETGGWVLGAFLIASLLIPAIMGYLVPNGLVKAKKQ